MQTVIVRALIIMLVVMVPGCSSGKDDYKIESPDKNILVTYHSVTNEYTISYKSLVVPFVEQNYRVFADKNGRAIAGFSGGGGETLFLGLNNPEFSSWVCGFAPGMRKEEFDRNNEVAFANPSALNKRLKLFWIGVGKEDGLYPVIADYMEVLKEKDIQHETFISDGGHTWMNCKLYLATIAQKIFQ